MRVTVVGAGFSGLLSALHLLRHPGVEVALVEKGPRFGTGAAYSTRNPDHLLNVRLGNMSAFPDDPDHLRGWLHERGRLERTEAFITRGLYGEYLRDLLEKLITAQGTGPRLQMLHGEVTDLVRADDWRAVVEGYGVLTSDAVVLALGNIEPHTPPVFRSLEDSDLYIRDPWRAAAGLPGSANSILLLGTGLTMVDVALSLSAEARVMTAISRRGLLPRAHADDPGGPEPFTFGGPPEAVLRQVRARSGLSDWRGVMDQIRPQVRGLWQSWSRPERGRALRHLRPFWDVHRHRLAPPVALRVEAMRQGRELDVLAGKIVSVEARGDKARIAWRPRRSRDIRHLEVDAVVNCTGPLSDIRLAELPLLKNLLSRGLVTSDPDGLGVQVTDDLRLVHQQGSPVDGLFAVGPLTRGAFWESTAVPDIRVQAAEVAASVLGSSKSAS